jgi:multiple sugar transport system ATP-binding protein
LQAGNIEQVGSPLELYNRPANAFVAGFIGSPRMNLLEGADAQAHGAKTIGVRPEHLDISTTAGQWKGKVSVAELLGSDTFLHVNVEGHGSMTVRAGGDVNLRHGDTVYLTPQDGKLHRFGEDGKNLA